MQRESCPGKLQAKRAPSGVPGNISNLKSDLRKYNLKLGGNKAELIQRLAEHYQRLPVLPQDVIVSAVGCYCVQYHAT